MGHAHAQTAELGTRCVTIHSEVDIAQALASTSAAAAMFACRMRHGIFAQHMIQRNEGFGTRELSNDNALFCHDRWQRRLLPSHALGETNRPPLGWMQGMKRMEVMKG